MDPDTRDNMMYGLLRDKKATYVTNHKRDWIHVQDVCTAIRFLAPSTLKGPLFLLDMVNQFQLRV